MASASLRTIAAAILLFAAAIGRTTAQSSLAFPIAEPPLAAQLAGIDPQWNISLRSGGKVRVVRAEDLAYFGRYADAEAGPQVLLRDGSIIRSDLLLLDDKQVVIGDATGLGRGQWDESALPRSALAALIWQPPADPAQRDRLLRDLNADPDDRLLLVGGQSLRGILVSAPRGGRFAEDVKPGSDVFELALRGRAEPLKIAASKVIAVRFSTSPAAPASTGAMSAWLGLKDGSLVRSTQIAVKGDQVTLTLAAEGQLKTTLTGRKDAAKKFWDEVTYLEPVGTRVVWLSDMANLGYRHIPYAGVERLLGRDQNALGGRLRAGRGVFRKGLGMASASRVAMNADGYRRFEAEIAIDAAAGLSGSVVFKVLLEKAPGDWQTAYESPPVRGGDEPLPISVDLARDSRLALLVDFSDRGDVCDWADWLHARLVK